MTDYLAKIESNQTGLRFCEEVTIGKLPAAANQRWFPMEPNSYSNWGGQTKLTQRSPITNTRVRRKGVLTDLDAAGAVNMDMTGTNYQRLMQGFMFASFREKFDTNAFNTAKADTVSAVATDDTFTLGTGVNIAALFAGGLVLSSGNTHSENDGLFHVSSAVGTTVTTVETTLVPEASPPSARLELVGVEFAAGDAVITASGTSYPVLSTTAFDLTKLHLVPGEFIFVGGDTAVSAYDTDTNNGFARVRSVAAHAIVFDKTTGTMVTDSGAGKKVQLFFGRVVKNEQNKDGPNGSIPIVRRTYQFERTLGSPDVAAPTASQGDYLVGSVPSKFKMTLKTSDKVVSDLEFVALTTDFRDTTQGLKSQDAGATQVDLLSEDAFNTSSHVARMRIAAVSSTDSYDAELVGFVSDFDFTIDNMLKPNKAIKVLGAFEITAGHFIVDGTMKAYFNTVAAQREIKQNGNVTFDIAFVEANKGVVVDMPLIALSDGRPEVVSDEPIMLPLTVALAPDPVLNYELLWVFFNYLPSVAQPVT
jgi:hypothetical protein